MKNKILTNIKSVNDQNYKNIEHIFIDKLSTDKTLSLIEENSEVEHKILSENDEGIYDAMNKGILLSSGDIVTFLNSDDKYIHNNYIEVIAKEFSRNPDIDIIFTNIIYLTKGKFARRYRVPGNIERLLDYGVIPPHPGMSIRRNVHISLIYDPNFKIASDFKFFLQIVNSKIKYKKLEIYSVAMSHGGISDNLKNKMLLNNEMKRINNDLNKENWSLKIYLRFFIKLFQFIRKS
jgi:glycosyltransferase involved in cell wall biosynthesis